MSHVRSRFSYCNGIADLHSKSEFEVLYEIMLNSFLQEEESLKDIVRAMTERRSKLNTCYNSFV